MSNDKVVRLPAPEAGVQDALTEVLRQGARKLIVEAVEAELEDFLVQFAAQRDGQGRQGVVRNGYLPARPIQTGIGEVEVQVPRVRDRTGQGILFHSQIVPRYLRRSRSVEELLPLLYLKGLSTGDFGEALSALLGPQAAGLSAASISRLKVTWEREYQRWQQRDLRGKRYVYVWVDGIYLEVRLESARHCLLVIIGADEQGRKELVGLWDGVRESEQSWKELLLELRQRGLEHAPKLAIGDGSLGFWKALRQVYAHTRQQRCWVHKTANVLNKLPKSLQKAAKSKLQQVWMAPGREEAQSALNHVLEVYGTKYPKVTECLLKDQEALLAFYDFPAEHWVHIRTTNPIESTFATVRLRTDKTRGYLSRNTALGLVFKLCRSAEKRWRRLQGAKHLAEIIEGVPFRDGVRVNREAA